MDLGFVGIFLGFKFEDTLGQCWAVLALCWAHVGSFDGFLGSMEVSGGKKITPNTKACRLRVILGNFLGLYRANVGPFWVQVGPMLGHLVGFIGFHGGFWREKIPTGKLVR